MKTFQIDSFQLDSMCGTIRLPSWNFSQTLNDTWCLWKRSSVTKNKTWSLVKRPSATMRILTCQSFSPSTGGNYRAVPLASHILEVRHSTNKNRHCQPVAQTVTSLNDQGSVRALLADRPLRTRGQSIILSITQIAVVDGANRNTRRTRINFLLFILNNLVAFYSHASHYRANHRPLWILLLVRSWSKRARWNH